MVHGKCEHCRQKYDQQRGSAAKRGYGVTWRQIRDAVIRRDPVCTSCMVNPSTDADHRVAKAKGGQDTMENLRGLCHSCHSRKTVTTDRGFGRVA